MTDRIDYYISLNSPWSYLGHERFVDIAARHAKAVTVHPVDFGVIFPETGGLPVGKRAPQRQAYRLVELARWCDHLGVALVLHPKHWPADERAAAAMVLAQREAGGDALRLAGAFLRAVWAEERDIADPETRLAIASACGADGPALAAAAEAEDLLSLRERESRDAIARGVFGAPTYVYRDELFWGQDRLDFLERALGR